MRTKPVRERRLNALELLESRQMLTATYLEAIGWTSLKAALGSAMPSGANISVAQIEHREQNIGGYQPDVSDPAFVGKTITIESGASINSRHATRVGQHLYGNTAGLAPGITAIDSWELDDWSSDFLNVGTTLEPDSETQDIQNHSWNGGSGPTDLEILRRFDYLVERDNIFAAIAIGNQGNLLVPKVLSSSYNGVVVGLTNGTANRGLTSFDGIGRTKPDIVAPEAKSSQATPQVSGAAALLLDQVSRSGWSVQNKLDASESIALKAMLLAGATKSQFASWSNTPQRPLDAVYGSGQVNVYNSYDILTAGQQESGSVTRQGWDFNQTAEPGSYRTYTFTVPDGTEVGEMSIALTWNRIIRSTLVGGFGNLQSDLADLNMAISRIDGDTGVPIDASLSAVDNVEYLSLRNLAAGTYQVAIAADQANVDYALAWNALANTSTTTLTAQAGPIAVGQNVTFTAKVAAGNLVNGNPSGTVTFFDGDTPLDTSILSVVNGVNRVSFSTSGLSEGTHTIIAKYAGQGGFSSSGDAITVHVGVVGTTTTVEANSTSTVYGQGVLLTANIGASGQGTPTGSVQFWDGATLLGTSAVASSANGGKATLSIATLSAASHTITATYLGDTNFGASGSSPLAITVAKATTTTSLVSSAPSAVFGQSVTLTATVDSPTANPIGNVTFKKGSAVLGTGVLIGGKATFTTTSLPIGTFALTAVYGGNANFNSSSSSSLMETVSKASTTTVLTSSDPIAAPGSPITFTAVITPLAPGGGVPTGNVTFKDGNTVLGTTALVNGQATWVTSSLTPGAHTIRAVYVGGASFKTSTSAGLNQTISQPTPTTTSLVSDANPAVFGQAITFTATVAASAGTPAGTVTFKRGGNLLATVPLTGGQASYTTSTLPVGNLSITATYNGSTSLAQSTSLALVQSVTKAATLSEVSSSAITAVLGQSLTFTASVLAVAPGDGIPTGTVTFRDGSKVLGTAALINGQATFTTTSLSIGSHAIRVVYSGSTNFKTSTSSDLPLTVTASLAAQNDEAI